MAQIRPIIAVFGPVRFPELASSSQSFRFAQSFIVIHFVDNYAFSL